MPSGDQNSIKTHCPAGHEYTDDNLLTADLKRGRRGCRRCHNARRNEARHAERSDA